MRCVIITTKSLRLVRSSITADAGETKITLKVSKNATVCAMESFEEITCFYIKYNIIFFFSNSRQIVTNIIFYEL